MGVLILYVRSIDLLLSACRPGIARAKLSLLMLDQHIKLSELHVCTDITSNRVLLCNE